jgi:LPS-assembly lipoprotein
MRLIGAGLTALVAVLALVLLQQVHQQASRSQALERRLQDLENRRDLERTQALEAQLRALAQRLQGLEASAGQVREFQLRVLFSFRLRTPQDKELIELAELQQQRDISYNESAALAKENEEALLYRDMQSDLVQQIMRRLSSVRAL